MEPSGLKQFYAATSCHSNGLALYHHIALAEIRYCEAWIHANGDHTEEPCPYLGVSLINIELSCSYRSINSDFSLSYKCFALLCFFACKDENENDGNPGFRNAAPLQTQARMTQGKMTSANDPARFSTCAEGKKKKASQASKSSLSCFIINNTVRVVFAPCHLAVFFTIHFSNSIVFFFLFLCFFLLRALVFNPLCGLPRRP